MNAIVLASGNRGKISEIQSILQKAQILPQSQFNVPEAEEYGTTFVENAIIKARNASRHCGLPAIADDSGLVVDAINGEPGIFSARYAGPEASDQENFEKLLQNMRDVPNEQRSARFICVMAYLRHADDPTPIIAQGIWEGQIMQYALGNNGFGYDPVFWVLEYGCSSAQLSTEIKNTISHRAQALQSLAQQTRLF